MKLDAGTLTPEARENEVIAGCCRFEGPTEKVTKAISQLLATEISFFIGGEKIVAKIRDISFFGDNLTIDTKTFQLVGNRASTIEMIIGSINREARRICSEIGDVKSVNTLEPAELLASSLCKVCRALTKKVFPRGAEKNPQPDTL